MTASDAVAILARPGTKRYASLVNRLVLDLEGVGQHTDEAPDPWTETHEADLRSALAHYRRDTGKSVLETGLCTHQKFSWLGASPHGLVGQYGCLHFRIRKTLKSFHVERVFTKAELARHQLTMLVCERAWCDVVDFWDGGGGVPDRMRVTRLEIDSQWMLETVFPRIIAIWDEIRAILKERRDQVQSSPESPAARS